MGSIIELVPQKPEKKRERYQSRRDAGLCVSCPDPPEQATAGVHCEGCRQDIREKASLRRKDRSRQGKCASCGRDHFGRQRDCLKCRMVIADAKHALYARRRRRGMCINCGKRGARPGQDNCAICQMADRRRKARQTPSDQKRAIASRYFETLYARQQGRCNICGKPVPNRLGFRTAHIDHVVPLSKGGSNAFSNLQLTCAPCNLRKGTKTDPDPASV